MRVNPGRGYSNNVCEDIGYMIFSNINNQGRLVGLNRHVIFVLLEFLTLNEYVRLSSTSALATQLQDFSRHPYLKKIFIDKVSPAIKTSSAYRRRGYYSYLSRFRRKAYQFIKNSGEDDVQQRLVVLQKSNLKKISDRMMGVHDPFHEFSARPYLASVTCLLLGPIITMCFIAPLVSSDQTIANFFLGLVLPLGMGFPLGLYVGRKIDYQIHRCQNRALLRAVNSGVSTSPNSASEPLLQQFIRELPVSDNANLSDVLEQLEEGRSDIRIR